MASSSQIQPTARVDVRAFRRQGFKLLDALVAAYPIDDVATKVLADARTGADGRDISRSLDREWTAAISGASFTVDGADAHVRTFANRFWIDLSITHNGIIYPVNFKAGKGASPDNVGGLRMWRYLILGEPLDSNTHALPRANLSESQLAKKAGELYRSDDPRIAEAVREYFCLHYNTSTGTMSRFGISDLSEDALKLNPKNGAQVKMVAHPAANRTNRESLSFILEKYREYLFKMSEPWRAFS